jgi:sulfur carrier protein ThiS
MIITINGKETQLPENAARTIDSLLAETTPVAPGDVIEFLYFMGGGR